MLSASMVNTNTQPHRQLMMRPDGRCYVFPSSTSGGANNANEFEEQPVSRTYQYRKVMKPMLERKRRARINRCLDELKELMLTALQSEGENVSKLEKADILELTVRHLHKLKRQRSLELTTETDRFVAGFAHCAAEVSQYLASLIRLQNSSEQSPKMLELSIDQTSGVKLLHHLRSCIQRIETAAAYRREDPYSNPYSTPPSSPSPNLSSFLSSVDGSQSGSPPPGSAVWRPW